MYIPEEFGKYLLLKKLTEDPLGETFRAGKVGKEGMEQVVLLRVLNGKGLDGEKLWQKVSGRAAVQQALRSPNIGSGVDLGKVRSFPYAAYDYISGKSLAAVLSQAARQMSPIPTDHAMLIAERLALALAAAFETRTQDERILHGFVVPQLVMISNEGETRLLGFEVAPGLREAAAVRADEAIRPYLSPEALAGAAPSKADDVWSLGAILFELLTGEALPAPPAGGYAALIDGATLANEGTPLPAGIVALLKKSLGPADQRGEVVAWHKTLSKMMIDGHYSPTTFNLAFFMHSLFRDEIERESREIEAERKMEMPQRVVAAAPVPAPVPPRGPAPQQDMRETTGVREPTWPGTQAAVVQESSSSKAPLFIGIAAAVLIALGVGGYFAFFRSGKEGTRMAATAENPAAANPATQTAAMPAAAVPGDPAAASAAGPSPEEIQTQIQAMFEARSKEMEAKLKDQYDDRIKQLQKQLEDSRKAGVEPRTPERQTAVAQPEPPASVPVETRPATRPDLPASQPSNPAPSTPAPQPAAGNTAQDNPVRSAAAAPSVAPPVQPTQQPSSRQVQAGDLVALGTPGAAAPKVKTLPEPRYPAPAQKLRRSAQVDIKVLVDERGRVLDAERVGTRAGFGFDEAALDAARKATFQPATKDGVKVKMWTTIRVAFKP
ncbi:MAG TPA: TonB family protein [Thermoanaerobaculia bacterium]|nr:TonB family protein [Thermoanaerobaculia bacterium]